MSLAETDTLNVASGLQAENTTPIGWSSKSETGRMSQLDGLRALAALMVIVHHELPHNPVSRMVDFGAAAVWLFFVLSGFLITGILVKSRRSAERSGASRLGVARSFYARRSCECVALLFGRRRLVRHGPTRRVVISLGTCYTAQTCLGASSQA